jgi:leucyl aminopeptidase
MKALSSLGLAVNVTGVIPAAYNAVDGRSYLPGDILTSFSGKTVEIANTDAEGRLVLADAVSYCQRYYRPTAIIDFATLTGGILVCLADFVAGLFSRDDALAQGLFEAGERTGERLWRLPLYEEYTETLKGDLADLRNISKLKRGWASSITGAAFIGHFVDEGMPWAHIDIAGTGFNEGAARGEIPQYGTGFGVLLIMEYLKTACEKGRGRRRTRP